MELVLFFLRSGSGRRVEAEGGAGGVPLTITPLQTSIDSMLRKVK